MSAAQRTSILSSLHVPVGHRAHGPPLDRRDRAGARRARPGRVMPHAARFVIATVIGLCVSVGAGPALPRAARTASISPRVTAAPPDNPIVVENRQAGTFGWLPGPNLSDDATGQIKGYWSATSVRQNESIALYVTVNPSQTYSLDIYRLGWYQ